MASNIASKSDWGNGLPLEILRNILSMLDIFDRTLVGRVCKAWKMPIEWYPSKQCILEFLGDGHYNSAKAFILANPKLLTSELTTAAIEAAIDSRDTEFIKFLVNYDYSSVVLKRVAKTRNLELTKLFAGCKVSLEDRVHYSVYSGDLKYIRGVCSIYDTAVEEHINVSTLHTAAATNLETFKVFAAKGDFSLGVLNSAALGGNVEIVEYIYSRAFISKGGQKIIGKFFDDNKHRFSLRMFLHLRLEYRREYIEASALRVGNLELLSHFGYDFVGRRNDDLWTKNIVDYVLRMPGFPIEEFVVSYYQLIATNEAEIGIADVLYAHGYPPKAEMFLECGIYTSRFLRWLRQHGCRV